MAQIHELIGKAMGKIGAIGKDSKNQQQGFMYRGIDAVYNALNPVMAELGLFICPEVLEQTREERVNAKGTTLLYSILKIKYTLYAPDGSNVSCTVIGEGMDTGDKASNKAMSIAMKYAMFQLFFIPTEAVDPDAEVHEVRPKATMADAKARVQQVDMVPPVPKKEEKTPLSEVEKYLLDSMKNMREMRGISPKENGDLFKAQKEALVKKGLAPNKPSSEYTMQEALALVDAMYRCFDPLGTELKTE